jgi:hypothetical protein
MACPVCFGGEDPVMRESLTAGLSVLLGVTFVVLACFARFFVGLARRAQEAAHLVEHGSEPASGSRYAPQSAPTVR